MVYGTTGGRVRISFTTINGNLAGAGAANLETQATASGYGVSVSGSIVAGAPSTNCAGLIVTAGHNIDDGNTCGFDRPFTAPRLQALAANGGPTQTEALGSGSPAIDTGGACGTPAFDQRGAARPSGNGCDLGAFESGGVPVAPLDPTYASRVIGDGADFYFRLDEFMTTVFTPYSEAYYHRLAYVAANVTLGQTGALLQDTDPAVKGNGTGPIATGNASYFPSISGGTARSVELWYRAAQAGATENFLCYGAGTGGVADFCLDSAAGIIQFNGTPFINPRVDDGAWHHVVVTYDGATSLLLYVDGSLASGITTAQLNTGTTTTQFGQHFGGTGNLTGYLDDIAFYGNVLTPPQVASHFAAR